MIPLKNFAFISLILLLLSNYTFAQNIKFEAEDAELHGVKIVKQISGYSGTGYVTGFDNENDKLVFIFDWDDNSSNKLYIAYSAPSGNKNNYVYVNGENLGNLLFSESDNFVELDAGEIYLNKGENIISIEKSWGWINVDYIRIDVQGETIEWNIAPEPVNENASPKTYALKHFLVNNFGKTTLAGQYVSDDVAYNHSNSEFSYIKNLTGKYPAVYGNDLINYSPSRIEFGASSNVTNEVINFYKNEGGIVTLSWHWNAPDKLINSNEQPWWSGFYTDATLFDIDDAINHPGSNNYNLLIRDIDAIAVQLIKLQEEQIPILWRPLHEAEGAWFWWGAKGPDPCVKLWRLLYDRLTNHHAINNLLWVWTTTDSPSAMNWYPGDEYVDILGVDVYLDNGDYSVSSSAFKKLKTMFNGEKLLTMSENGTIPNPINLYNYEAHWSYFCTWSGDFILDGIKNTSNHLDYVFNHKNITTLDEIPDDLYTYVGFYNLNNTHINTSIQVYPIPFQSNLNLTFENEPANEIEVIDISGRKVKCIKNINAEKNISISMLNEATGLYFIKASYNNRIEVIKAIKN